MTTRFFSTSKPIHLVIVSVFVFLLFFVIRAELIFVDFDFLNFFRSVAVCLALIFSIIVLAFFVTKNNLTLGNSYKIIFYALFLAIIPSTFLSNEVLWANLFVMLALRRIISLRTKINIKKKLYDAAFWIGIASLFYFWSFLFFALVLAGILLFSLDTMKNWIVPFIGLITVAILVICYSLLFNDFTGSIFNYIDTISYDFTPYNDLKFIISATILISLGIWALFFYIKSIKDKPKVSRAAHILIIFSAFLGMVIVAVCGNKNGSEFIFLFAPLAVIMSNYIQIVSDRWFAEAFLWILVLTPISTLLL